MIDWYPEVMKNVEDFPYDLPYVHKEIVKNLTDSNSDMKVRLLLDIFVF